MSRDEQVAAQDHVCGPDCQCGCEAGLTIPVPRAPSAAPVHERPGDDQPELQRAWDRLHDAGFVRSSEDESSAASTPSQREAPLCEVKNCPNRAIGLVEDRRGVKWAACEKHAREVLDDAD